MGNTGLSLCTRRLFTTACRLPIWRRLAGVSLWLPSELPADKPGNWERSERRCQYAILQVRRADFRPPLACCVRRKAVPLRKAAQGEDRVMPTVSRAVMASKQRRLRTTNPVTTAPATNSAAICGRGHVVDPRREPRNEGSAAFRRKRKLAVIHRGAKRGEMSKTQSEKKST